MSVTLFTSISLMRMRENGLQEREAGRIYAKQPRCTSGGGNFDPVSMADIRPALFAFVFGASFGAIILFVELLYARFL